MWGLQGPVVENILAIYFYLPIKGHRVSILLRQSEIFFHLQNSVVVLDIMLWSFQCDTDNVLGILCRLEEKSLITTSFVKAPVEH